MARKQTNKDGMTDADVEGNVDKIRDILFGGQMRDYDQRFNELEKRLNQSIERLSRDFEKRIERLDGYTKREVDKLADQVKAERQARKEDAKAGGEELQHLTDQVETWFAEVDDQVATESKELRAELHDQHETLVSLVREARDQLNEALLAESRKLADQKLAREDLASLLSEVALRLQNDFKLPKA